MSEAEQAEQMGGPKRDTFRDELRDLVNRYSRENGSNTPDFILADYLDDCLRTFDRTLARREKWYGRDMTPPEIVPE